MKERSEGRTRRGEGSERRKEKEVKAMTEKEGSEGRTRRKEGSVGADPFQRFFHSPIFKIGAH
jgi:hypothetical protein